MEQLIRSNKVTTRFEGEGVAVGTFYKTHDKLGEVKSTDAKIIELGFKMPESVTASEGVEPIEVTPKQKLDAFRDFLQVNATVFGYVYDPIDRRSEGNKYPSTYTEVVFLDTASKILTERITELVISVQKTIDNYAKQGSMPEGSQLACGLGIGNVTVQEKYGNGNLKYADVIFPVTFAIGDKNISLNVPVKLVSGQIKKPRELSDKYVMTITGLKTALVDGGVLPTPPQKEEEEGKAKENPAGNSTEVAGNAENK